MKKQIFFINVVVYVITASLCCKEKPTKKDEGALQSDYTTIDTDSSSHANGKKLFGIYCLTCHTFSQNLALLGNSQDITLDSFFIYVLRDSLNIPVNKNTHLKFDTLTKKDVSDIKYYLDKG